MIGQAPALIIRRQARRKALGLVPAFVLVAVLSWRAPPFHIVPLKRMQEQQQAAVVDPARAAAQFWYARLLPATTHAFDAREVLTALAKDGTAARKRYGRTAGLGSATLFFVKGTGHVAAVGEEAIVVALDGGNATVSLSTGLVFGNAVRDATGLLDLSAYPSSEEFNDLSAQVNRIVETTVIPFLRERAVLGKRIRFAGCIELEEDAKAESLPLIPVRVEWP